MAALSIVLSLIARYDSSLTDARRCLTCRDGEACAPQDDGVLVAHGAGSMSPYKGDSTLSTACSTAL